MGLLERATDYGRKVHLASPCNPARPTSCRFCAEAARASKAPAWLRNPNLNAKELAR